MKGEKFKKKVNVGDLVLLRNFDGDANASLVGYVLNFTENSILLSNRETRNSDGSIRDVGFFSTLLYEKRWQTYYGDWASYEILRQYSPKSP